jgi:probable phosphoglycerate mutase
MRRLWVVRHGQTAWAAAGRHTSSTDVPLDELGEQQARALATRLPGPWTAVLCSPLQRAWNTAMLAGLSPTPEPALREWEYGPQVEGRTTAELSADGPWNQWDDPRGESLQAVGARTGDLLQRLPAGDILLVAHGHVLRVLAAVYLGLDPVVGRHLALSPARIGKLGTEHTWPVLEEWNV